MSLDMHGLIDPTMAGSPESGVTLRRPAAGGYGGPKGEWQESGESEETELTMVTIQAVSKRDVELLEATGGTAETSDLRRVYLNDGTMLSPGDDVRGPDVLVFADTDGEREWRVRSVDNRPWRNYCKAVVERYRGSR